MAQEVFERYEKKYMLSAGQKERLMAAVKGRFVLDGYGRHQICNIYFDTPDYQLIRTSLQKPVYKEKLRLRSYGICRRDDPVYLELKKKYCSVVYKRRTQLSLQEAGDYMAEGRKPPRTGQIFREADYTMKRYGLRPMVFISYEREAYSCGEESGLRMTFDQKILARDRDLRLDRAPYGTPLLEPGQTLMELKIPGAMPVWLSRILAGLAVYPVTFSKYGVYYQQNIYPQAAERTEGGRHCA